MPIRRSNCRVMQQISSHDGDKSKHGGNLHENDRGIEIRGFAHAQNENSRNQRDHEVGRQIHNPAHVRQGHRIDSGLRQHRTHGGDRRPLSIVKNHQSSGRGRQLRRNAKAQGLKQRHQIAAPSSRHRCRSHGILDDQVPADDPGENFAERGVPVRVGGPGNRNQRGEFGVAQTRKDAADSGENERQHNGRPRKIRRHGSGQDENSRADDGAHAERDQIHRAQHAPQRVIALFLRFLQQRVDWFRGQQIRH